MKKCYKILLNEFSNALENNKRGFQNSSKQHYNSATLLKLSQQMGNRHIYTYVPIGSQNFGQTRLVQCTLSDAKKIMLTWSGQAQSQSDMFLHGVQLFLSPMLVSCQM